MMISQGSMSQRQSSTAIQYADGPLADINHQHLHFQMIHTRVKTADNVNIPEEIWARLITTAADQSAYLTPKQDK